MKNNVLFKYSILSNLKYFKEKNIARKVVILFFILSSISLVVIETLIYTYLFLILKNNHINISVVNTLISISLLFILIFAFISSTALLFKNFHINNNESIFLTFPINRKEIIKMKILESLMSNTLIILIFSIPIILVYLFIYYKLNIFLIILSLILILTLSIMITLISSIIVMLSQIIFSKINNENMKISISLIVIFIFILFLAIHSIPNLALLSKTKNLKSFTHIMNLYHPNIFIPSSLISSILVYKNSIIYILILIIEFIFCYLLYRLLEDQSNIKILNFQKPYRNIKYIKSVVINKDLNSYINEEKNVINSISIFFLIIIFTILLIGISQINIPNKYYNLFYTLIIGSFAYIITLIALYFIYPSLSKEKNGGWLIFSSIIKRKVILIKKYIASLIFIYIQSFILYIIFLYFLNLSITNFYYFTIFAILITFSITTLFLMTGIAYPNFQNSSSKDLSTTPPALVASIISIFYILITLIIFYKYGILLSSIVLIILSIIITISSLIIGIKKFNNMDINI